MYRCILITLTFYGLIFFLSGCTNNRENIDAYNALSKSLSESNRVIDRQTGRIHHSLDAKLSDPKSAMKAVIVRPQALLVSEFANAVLSYVDSLKYYVKEDAGLERKNGKEFFDEADQSIGERLFLEKGKAVELSEKVSKFKASLLSIDSSINEQFRTDINSIDRQDSLGMKPGWLFYRLPTSGILAMLTALQNKVKILEHNIVEYCDARITFYDEGYTLFNALAGLSSNLVKQGDTIEVFAGVGAFSIKANPQIIINGKVIPVGVEGIAVSSFKSPGKVGIHTVRVVINYTDDDGSKKSILKSMRYRVAK